MEQHKCGGCGRFVKGGTQCSCGAKPKEEKPQSDKQKMPSDKEIFKAADKVAKKLPPYDKNKPTLRKGFAEQLFEELDGKKSKSEDEEEEEEF